MARALFRPAMSRRSAGEHHRYWSGLVALILTFGPISGAHFNPAVTLADASQGGLPWKLVPGYIVAQGIGAIAGVYAAHGMFGLALMQTSKHARAGGSQLFSEFIATFGLLAVIWGCSRAGALLLSHLLLARILPPHTGSQLIHVFRQPRCHAGPVFHETFAGIRPIDAPLFILVQIVGAFAATGLFRWLAPATQQTAEELSLFHTQRQRTEVPFMRKVIFASCTMQVVPRCPRFFNKYADPAKWLSAGTQPAPVIPWNDAMKEVGLDVSVVLKPLNKSNTEIEKRVKMLVNAE